MDTTIWLGIGFLLLGLERLIPTNIPPWIAGVIFLILGLIILVPALA
jgi:membrane protein implicated in regulation of membrane protease activity